MQLTHVFSETRQGLRRNVTMHLAMVLTLFISLTLVGIGVLMYAEAQKTQERYGDLNEVAIYLCNKKLEGTPCAGKVTDAQRDRVIELAKKNRDYEGMRFESQREAYDNARELFKDSPAALEALDVDDMRESIWVQLETKNGKIDEDSMDALISSVVGLDGVRTVQDNRDVVGRIFSTLNVLKWASLIGAVFLVIAALLLVANTIRLAAFARRREIAIMRLVGASTLYVALPFLMESLVMAVAGIVMAGAGLAAIMQFGVIDRLSEQIQFLSWVGWSDYVVALEFVAAVGLIVTLVPTLLLTRKYLKV